MLLLWVQCPCATPGAASAAPCLAWVTARGDPGLCPGPAGFFPSQALPKPPREASSSDVQPAETAMLLRNCMPGGGGSETGGQGLCPPPAEPCGADSKIPSHRPQPGQLRRQWGPTWRSRQMAGTQRCTIKACAHCNLREAEASPSLLFANLGVCLHVPDNHCLGNGPCQDRLRLLKRRQGAPARTVPLLSDPPMVTGMGTQRRLPPQPTHLRNSADFVSKWLHYGKHL